MDNPVAGTAARPPASLAEVVASGLCIGCGLCEALSDGAAPMRMTAAGSLRPQGVERLPAAVAQKILAACPGAAVRARADANAPRQDAIWGGYYDMRYAWAGEPEVRHRAATGGVLTALARHLLASGQASFVLHVKADENAPMRSRWTMSDSPDAALAAAGSRYGPVAPLAGLEAALARRQPFAVVAKPCDLSALHNLAAADARVDELCRWRLALVCGGQSRLGKSQMVLDELGVEEKEVTLFRYRGHGNPGKTRIETVDGRVFEKTYNEMWADEAGWQIETRCKLCADALGECADVIAADVWENAQPAGEDAGFNGVAARTAVGQALLAAAAAAGYLTLGDEISPAQFTGFQPHQSAKKRALAARFAGLAAAGRPAPAAQGLRLHELSHPADSAAYETEKQGTLRRAQQGRFDEAV